MARTKIEWADRVWNPVSGCEPVSEGCEHCYAMRWAERLRAMGVSGYERGFEIAYHPERLEEPLRIKKPQVIFVGSMGDLFHARVRREWVQDIFAVMRNASWHRFIILTKRPARARWEFAEEIATIPNLWVGITAENEALFWLRMIHLANIPTRRFVSFEPLLRAIDPNAIRYFKEMIEGVIVGGETGAGARNMKEKWVDDIRGVCEELGIRFFFKQWGGRRGRDRIYQGKEWNDLPWNMEN